MKLNWALRTGVTGVLLVALSGCYEYPPPPSSTLGQTYTQRKQDDADLLLEGITDLTLADAQRIAICNNPTYIAAYHAVSAARMRYYQALGAYSPVVSASFNLNNAHNWQTRRVNQYGAHRTNSFSTNTGIQATWLVFDGLNREFTVRIAEHDWDYMRDLEDDEARILMRAVAYAYNSVLLAIENKRIALEDRDFQESSLHDTELKYQAGAVPLSDVLNFQIAMNSAESNLITADYEYETAIYALAVLMGYPEGTLPNELKFPSDFKSNFSDLPSVDIYLDTALCNRPDLKGFRELLEVARYQMYQTYSTYSPTVNAYVNGGYGTNLSRYSGGAVYSHTYGDTPSLSYGLTADWLIFNGLIRYNRMREFQANLAIAEFTVATKWLEVVGEVRAAYSNYIQAVKQTRLFEQTRELSAKQRDLVDEGYKAGNTELTRLNEAQRDLVEAETNLASSYINIQNAKAQLDAAVAANSADYYKDPEHVAPGVIQYTPVTEDSVFAVDSGSDLPKAQVQDSMIPPVPTTFQEPAVRDPGLVTNLPDAPPAVLHPDQAANPPAPGVPVIPADPTVPANR